MDASEQNSILEKLQSTRNRLVSLSNNINIEFVNPKKYSSWGGSGLIVTLDINTNSGFGDDIIIKSPSAHYMVWLIRKLQDICRPCLTHFVKYEFYGKIGESLNRYLTLNLDNNVTPDKSVINPEKMCFTVIIDIVALIDEWEKKLLNDNNTLRVVV